eukprot:Tamp_34355.p1 GENE.Tamp_34355~~Tamp_34355.p1  ORF type:complete len:144 (-),score=18.50 Tamp_34355:175-555(-)
MAVACGPEIEAFLGCSCHVPRDKAAGQCSKLMCQDLEDRIRQCSQRNLRIALHEVEGGCEQQLDAFVRCCVTVAKNKTDQCALFRVPLKECAESVLGNRATMFTASLSNPEGLVNYRVVSGKTAVD